MNSCIDVELSIVLPAYRAERTIERAIQSAMSLASMSIEIIVIDDGSDDRTGSIVSQISATDPRVRIVSQSNKGRSAARGAGVAAARGKWTMFLDADDYLLSGASAVLADYVHDCSLDLAVFSYEQVGLASDAASSRNEISKNLVLSSQDVLEEMLAMPGSAGRLPGGMFEMNAVWARLYRTERLRELCIADATGEWCPFPVGLRFSEDRLLNIAYLASGGEFAVGFCPLPVYCWDLGESQTCGVVKPDDISRIDLYRCYCDDLVRAYLITKHQANCLFTLELANQFQRAICQCDAPLGLLLEYWKHAITGECISHIDVSQIKRCVSLRKWLPGLMLIKHGFVSGAFKSYRSLIGLKRASKCKRK